MYNEIFNDIIKKQIPIAWIAGVRFESYKDNTLQTSVVFDFLNQNPFGSMFWAVEGMAAEFAGGMMLLTKIQESGKSIATLVVRNEVNFKKKAIGKIIFTCNEGEKIDRELQKAIETGEGHLLELNSYGTDEQGDIVAEFKFIWSIKLRK